MESTLDTTCLDFDFDFDLVVVTGDVKLGSQFLSCGWTLCNVLGGQIGSSPGRDFCEVFLEPKMMSFQGVGALGIIRASSSDTGPAEAASLGALEADLLRGLPRKNGCTTLGPPLLTFLGSERLCAGRLLRKTVLSDKILSIFKPISGDT